MSEKDDMAQALRELLNNWRNRYGVYVNGRPSLTTDNCIHDIKSLLAAHDSRARPESVPDGQIAERLDILRRICTRGKNYFVETQDSMGVDLFDHMTTEVGYLAGDLGAALQPQVRECERNSAAGCACKNVCVALSGDDPLSGVNQSQLKKLKESTNDL